MRLPSRVRLSCGAAPLADARVAASLWTRFLGLMGVSGLPAGEGLLLLPCNSVHTWCMRFPIDVVFLDADWRVLRVLPAMRPWRFSPLVRGARSVLELPPGAAARAGVQPGSVLTRQAL